MKRKILLVAALVLVSAISLPSITLATHIQAKVGDTSLSNDDAACSNCLYLDDWDTALGKSKAKSYTQGTITVSIIAKDDTNGQRARIEVTSADVGLNGNDWIELRNMKATTTAAFTTEFYIGFWSTFTDEPHTASTTPPLDVNYQLTLSPNGTLKSGASGANGATVKSRGWIGFPVESDGSVLDANWHKIQSADLTKTITTTNYTFFGSSLNQLWGHTAELTSSRVLEGEQSYTMPQSNDILLIQLTSPGLVIQNTASQQPPCPSCPSCPPCPPWPYLGWSILVVVVIVIIYNFIIIRK